MLAFLAMPRKLRRISNETAAALKLFLADPKREWFGLDIVKEAEIQSGSLYPILHRLEDRSILSSSWEPQSVAVANKRRPRCLDRLDPRGLDLARLLLQEWEEAKAGAPAMIKAPKGQPIWTPSPSLGLALAATLWCALRILGAVIQRLGDRIAAWLFPDKQPFTFRLAIGIAILARTVSPSKILFLLVKNGHGIGPFLSLLSLSEYLYGPRSGGGGAP